MPQRKISRIYRTNLVNVGIGQGQMKAVPYLLSITEFNRNGQTLARSNYSADSLLTERIVWDYDDNGQILSEYYYTDEDEPSETVRFERDEKGKVIRDIKKYLDGSEDVTTYQYDENDHLTGKVTIDDEGSTYSGEEFTWEGKNLIRHLVTDSENNQAEKDEFEYDNNGNVLEHRRINEETGENFRTVSRYNDSNQKTSEKIYNEDNELMESTVFKSSKDGKLLSSTTESRKKKSSTRYFYDERGNHLGQEKTDQEGNQILWVEHTYDEQNDLSGTVVFVNGGLVSASQHYELSYEYEWYDEA